jgi:hypothetical protein
MPSTLDKILGPIEEKTGKGKARIGYYEDLNLTEGEQRDPQSDSKIGGGIGIDSADNKRFLWAEGKKGPLTVGVETKSKNEYSGNVGYNIDEGTRVGVTAKKDDSGKSVGIGIKKDFNKGGKVSKISKGRQAIVKKFGHEGAIDPKKAQITKLLSKGGEVSEIGKGKDYIKDLL